jgi:amino acid adenylation domain-containing protein
MPMIDKSEGVTLRSGFFAHADKNPAAPALVVRGETISYGQLSEKVRTWAQAILGLAGSPVARVGVFAYRSEPAYAGVLAALAAGGAFVPLNLNFPPEKTAAMIQQAKLDVIIVDRTCAVQLGTLVPLIDYWPPLLFPDLERPNVPARCMKVLKQGELETIKPLRELPPVVSEDLAYLLFTSGSTGQPKGVGVTHGNAMHFLDAMAARYGIGPDDRFSQTFDQTFDLSVFDLFLAWNCGACVFSMSPVDLLAPAGFVNKHRLTVWFSVPSVVAQMRKRKLLKPDSMRTLRWSLFCGEPLTRANAEGWQGAAPNSTIENLYGPTELTIACLLYRWHTQHSPALCLHDWVPIGRPVPGLAAVVVDDNLQPVAPGEIGELCVSGPQTTPGYWQDDAKTSERFIWLSVSTHEVRRFYRTGDHVIRLDTGDYAFLGRHDDQVKVLGHRVELGEIEAALCSDSRVNQAVAFGWPIEDGSAKGTVGFVSGTGIDTVTLIQELVGRLPAYMIPEQLHVLEEMPLNANGKIDRKALRARLEEVTGLPTRKENAPTI